MGVVLDPRHGELQRGRARLDVELQDYVIVHELLHLAAPNHGRLWKSLMRAHLGEYERLDVRLRAEARR